MTGKAIVPMEALAAMTAPALAETATQPAQLAAVTQTDPAAAAVQLTSAEDCKKVGLDLAQIAEDRKLPDAKLETLEELMSRMSDFCAEQKFTEASALAKDLRTLIEKM